MTPLIILALLIFSAPSYGASMFLVEEGHCHYNFDYVGGQWQMSFRHETDGNWPLDRIINHARTNNWPNGSRFIRPAGSQWDFTGVAEGEPLYIFPQSNPGNVLWPSFSSDQTPPSAFAAYSESDPRVPFAPTRWVTYHIERVRYWGGGRGLVSIWNSTIAGPLIWMTMTNGITSEDRFFLELGGHVHMNWGFSDIGWYEMDARASAYITHPTAHTTSPPARIYFGIGVTGAPPAELTISQTTNGQPVVHYSAPGPGTNIVQIASDPRLESWSNHTFTTEARWTQEYSGATSAFYRLVK